MLMFMKHRLHNFYCNNFYLFDPLIFSLFTSGFLTAIINIIFYIEVVKINIKGSSHFVYYISKYIIFNLELKYVIYYFIVLFIFLFIGMYKSFKFNYLGILHINTHKYAVMLLKSLFDYVFTMISTIFTVMSLLLALDYKFTTNSIILYMTIVTIPIISTLKAIQLWYSFALPKYSSGVYNWDLVYIRLRNYNGDYSLDEILSGEHETTVHF